MLIKMIKYDEIILILITLLSGLKLHFKIILYIDFLHNIVEVIKYISYFQLYNYTLSKGIFELTKKIRH